MILFIYISLSIMLLMGIGMISTGSIISGIIVIFMALLFLLITYTGNKQNKIDEAKKKLEKELKPSIEINDQPINEKIITSIKTVVNGGVTSNIIVFELKGLFYRDQEAKDEAAKLVVGSPLNIKVDAENKGLKVVTLNDIHLGYVPADLSPVFYQQIETLASCIVHSKDDMRIPHIWIETIFKK